MEITGKLIAAMPVKKGVSVKTGNQWMSREYVLEYKTGEYTHHCVFRVFGEEKLRSFNLRKDENVTVYFDIDAHEYNGRWFPELTAYKVEKIGSSPTSQSVQPQPQPAPSASAPPETQQSSEDGSDLPF